MDQMTDSEMNQQRHDYFHSEPCIILRVPNISQPNIRTVVTASGNTSNIDSHYLVDAYDNGVMYGMTQFNGIHYQHNLDMGVAASSNLYYSGMNPSSGTGVLPQSINHRASEQLPASSTYAVSGFSSDNFGRCNGFMDDARGPYKRKIAEGTRGNYQYFNGAASSSVAPPNARHSDGVALLDSASFSPPQFRGNGFPSLVEVGPHGNMWSRSGESFMEHNQLIRGNYLAQHFQPAPPPSLDRQLNSTNSDGHNMAWNQSHSMPYMQAPTINGSSLENANMGIQRYHDTANNRNGLRFPHAPPVNHLNHNCHLPTLPMPGGRGQNINFCPPVASATYRVQSNSSRSTVIPMQNGFELGARHVGSAPSAGLRINSPLRGVMPETTLRIQNFPRMRLVFVDDVAMLNDSGNLVDHLSDMRLDIDNMSYEELLALGERIGNVRTGLSEETITTQLKTKTYKSSTTINLEEAATSRDQETDNCIICQDDYKNREMIGILKCGHEYHADCLKKWLVMKNVCPICKSEALTPRRKDV